MQTTYRAQKELEYCGRSSLRRSSFRAGRKERGLPLRVDLLVMSELLSSAWNYLSGGGGEGGGGGGSRFVGLEVDMGGGKVVKIKKIIAEGQVLYDSHAYPSTYT